MNAGLKDSRLNASSLITGRSLLSHVDASRFAKLSLNRRRAAIEAPWSSSASRARMVSWDTSVGSETERGGVCTAWASAFIVPVDVQLIINFSLIDIFYNVFYNK